MDKTIGKELSVIGCGRTGKALCRLFHQNRVFHIGAVVNRTAESSREAVAFIGKGRAALLEKEVCSGDVIMIAVPDDLIESVAQRLALCGCIKSGTVVFHCSGFRSSDALKPLAKCGFETGSVHPVRSFADPQAAVSSFDGTPCAMEGTQAALALLGDAFSRIGAEVFTIKAETKPVYHSATVFLSNYIVALLASAQKLLVLSDVSPDQANKVISALAPQAVANFLSSGAVSSLTGPVARGDIETVKHEISALAGLDSSFSSLYKILGQSALRIAEMQNLSSEQVEKLARQFRLNQS